MAATSLNRDPVQDESAQRKLAQCDLIQLVAEEMVRGVRNAVDCWMTEIDLALTDHQLTTLGRLDAVREIVENYKHLIGQVHLDCRTLPALGTPRAHSS
jgi:hypothetical protein